jgi:hypothetical protein
VSWNRYCFQLASIDTLKKLGINKGAMDFRSHESPDPGFRVTSVGPAKARREFTW